jgi:hypothetical protein
VDEIDGMDSGTMQLSRFPVGKGILLVSLEQLVNESLARHGVQVEQAVMPAAEVVSHAALASWPEQGPTLAPAAKDQEGQIGPPAPLPAGF